MPKRSKTFMLPQEAIAWLSGSERHTGLSQSRILLAALLLYARDDPETQRRALSSAFRVDKGEERFPSAPATSPEHELCYLRRLADAMKASGFENSHRDIMNKVTQLEKAMRQDKSKQH